MIEVLIADDEPPARAKLRLLLGQEEDVEIVGEARDGEEAIREVRRLRPQVVFLDIRMPQRDGFGVIEALGPDHPPLFVFVTAHEEHALDAFEVHAVDYLLKPFSATRLRGVLARVRERLLAREGRILLDRLRRAVAQIETSSGWLRHLLVEARPNRQILLRLAEVHLVRSRRNYVELHTTDGEFLRRGTLTELEDRLDPNQFARINRSEIVRLDAVREIQPWFRGDSKVILRSGETLTWSRRFRARRDRL